MKKTNRSGHCGQGWGRRLSWCACWSVGRRLGRRISWCVRWRYCWSFSRCACLRQNLLRRAQHNEAHQGHNKSLEARRDLQSGGYVAHAESPPRMNVADESSLDARRVRV